MERAAVRPVDRALLVLLFSLLYLEFVILFVRGLD